MAVPFEIIELDRPRKLRLGMKNAIEFEKTNKIKLMDVGENMTMEVCAKLAYTMLKSDDPTLTLEKTIDLLDEYLTMGEAIEKITAGIQAAFPKSPNVETPTA